MKNVYLVVLDQDGLVVKPPQIGQVDVERFIGSAWQKECLIYIGIDDGVQRIADRSTHHDVQVRGTGCTSQTIRRVARVISLIRLSHAVNDQVAILQNHEAAAIANGHVVLIPLYSWLRCTLRIAYYGSVAVDGGAHGALHGLLDERGRELDYSQFGRGIASYGVLHVQSCALIHARVGFLG